MKYWLTINPNESTEKKVSLNVEASDVERLQTEGVFDADETPPLDAIAYHLVRCGLIDEDLTDKRWILKRGQRGIGRSA